VRPNYPHADQLNVVGATNQKGRDVSVVEHCWAVNSTSRDGWWVAHVSNFTAQNINASDHYVESLTQQLKQRQAMIVDRVND
jgi:hypothetical protein